MSKRHPPTDKKSAATAAKPPRGGALGIGVLLATVLLVGGLATAKLIELWRVLPANQLSRLGWRQLQELRNAYSGDAHDAFVLVANSEDLTHCIIDANDLPRIIDEVRGRLPLIERSQLGRLQLATLTMLQLSHTGVEPKAWWPSVRAYLEGLDRATFDPCLRALFKAEEAAFATAGLRLGADLVMARFVAGSHGPFLQKFVALSATLRAGLRESGDDAAAQAVERLVRRVLREWLAQPMTASLLAADLLANELRMSGAELPAVEQRIVSECDRVRAATRDGLRGAPNAPAFARLGEPQVGADAALRYADVWYRAATPFYVAAATAGIGLLAIVLAVPAFRLPRPKASLWQCAAAGTVVATLAIGGVWLLLSLGRATVDDEIAMLLHDPPRMPTTLVVAAALGAAGMLAASVAARLIAGARGAFVATTSRIGLFAAVLCALAVWALSARVLHSDVRAAAADVARSIDQSPFERDSTLLHDLRQWPP